MIKMSKALALLALITCVTAHIKQHKTIKALAENCSAESSDFPDDIFTIEERQDGAIVLHLIGALYCFLLIAIVCNDYFLPSVDCICQDLKLTKDVAGATFMALATSAPELFVNIIGTFLTESDLGVGTVVGSDVFNTLGVAACGGLAAAHAIQLEIWPLARDCSIFMAVVALLGIILWDEKVEWYEALTLVFLYILYCTFLFCQKQLHNAAKSLLKSTKSLSSQLSRENVLSERQYEDGMDRGVYKPYHHHGETLGSGRRPSHAPSSRRHSAASTASRKSGGKEPVITISGTIVNGKLAPPEINNVLPIQMSERDMEEEEETLSGWRVLVTPPDGIKSKLYWALCWPLTLALFLTVPDCTRYRRMYPLTFIMCTVWIGASSYFVSWMMTVIGETFHVSDSVMGLTLVAMGGSMPEASTSIINARRGIGSMSISNALGGNTLDILLSLGLPWFIKTQLPASMDGGPVIIQSQGLVYNNAAQLACTAALFIAAAANRFRMNRVLGISCLIMYLLFIAFIVMMEAGVFGIKGASSSSDGC